MLRGEGRVIPNNHRTVSAVFQIPVGREGRLTEREEQERENIYRSGPRRGEISRGGGGASVLLGPVPQLRKMSGLE